MRLRELIEGVEVLRQTGDLEREIAWLHDDSRQVRPGTLFVAVPGFRQDGHAHIPQALAAGASAVVVEVAADALALPPGIVAIQVPDCRSALPKMAANFYAHPSRHLLLIGVTGTNGKTTTTYLIESLFAEGGHRVGVIGTINYRFQGREAPAERTTPESLELQRVLREMVDEGIGVVVMEVSSHALELQRVSDCEFDLAIFTNLTRDHLDFHGDLDHYLQAKLRLFSSLGKGAYKGTRKLALINRDDPHAPQFLSATPVQAWGYGLMEDAEIRPSSLEISLGGIAMAIQAPPGPFEVRSSLIGEHNVYNLLAAVGAGIWAEVPPAAIAGGIARLRTVPGRWERIEGGQEFTVVVDYAHTGDALERTLSAAKRLCRGRLILVFGCGGDRDRGKRAVMGEIAARYSDYFLITSDNPRSEDPEAILAEIEEGVKKACPGQDNYGKITDRREAIGRAIDMARREDFVIIAGKGHETYQILRDRTIPFDDREVARIYLAERFGKGA